MTLSETCIRRPVLTTLVTASIIVLGIFAYRLLAVAALPTVDFPTISIQGQLPGASAETMAASVAAPIERPAHYLRVTVVFERPFWRGKVGGSYFLSDAFGGCCVYDEGLRHACEPYGVLG